MMNRSSLTKLSCAGLILFSSVAYSSVALAEECLSGDCTNGEGVQSIPGGGMFYPSIYVGQFRNGKHSGSGTLYFKHDGIILSGLWKEGVFVKGAFIDASGTVHYEDREKELQRKSPLDNKEQERE